MVIYQPIQPDAASELSLEQLYGSCADDPIAIDDLGIAEASDDNLAGAFE